MIGACALLATAAWAQDLWLDRGGWWRERVPVAIVNRSANDWHEASLPVSVPALAAARPESLRLVGEGGTQLLFSVSAPGRFLVPASIRAGGAAVYHFYAGNDEAWALADSWTKPATPNLAVETVVGEKERLTLVEEAGNAPWEKDAAWAYRVPVRVMNLSDKPLTHAFSSVSAAEVHRATRNPVMRLVHQGKTIPSAVVGNKIFFFASVPARTVATYYFYVRPGTGTVQRDFEASGLASEIPSDPRFREKVRIDPALRRDFTTILESGVNLLANGLFQEGAKGWTAGKPPAGVVCEMAPDGLFGANCAHLVCTPNSAGEKSWKGWRQRLRIEKGRSYVYGAFVKTAKTTQRTSVHLHCLDARGRAHFGNDAGRIAAPSQLAIGDNGWTPLFGQVTPAADIEEIELHLTMSGAGEVWHDGAFIAEAGGTVRIGAPEPAPLASDALHVAPTSPIVKVFPETAVVDTKGPFAFGLARNETEDLQLAVRAGSDRELVVAVEPPRNAAGWTLAVETGVVGLVPVDYPSAYYSRRTGQAELRTPNHGAVCDGFSGWWPDPVVATNRVHLPARSARAVRLAVTADAQTPPGAYRGAVVWSTADGRVLRRDEFVATVWDFALPERPSFAATYDVRFTARQNYLWKRPGEKDMSGAKQRVLDFMAKYKICPDAISVDPTFTRAKDGSVKADFSAYDKEAAVFFDHYRFPNAYSPRQFYLFGWGHPPKKFLGEEPYEGTRPFAGVNRGELRPAYRRIYQAALKLFWNHLKEKGWDKKVVLYISDEPYFNEPAIRDQMIALCRMIHEVDPGIRIYSSTWRHCPAWDQSLDIWGVGAYGCFPTDEMKRLSAEGRGIWFTTDGQQCLDTPWCAIERMQPLYCWAYGAEKYEFWGCNWLTYDPWKFGWHSFIRQAGTPGDEHWVRYPNGDGYHIYPPLPGSTTGTPEASLRLCAIRDGVEEFTYYEKLAALAAAADAPAARREAAEELCAAYRALVPIPNAGGRNSTKILPEPEVLDRLRLRAGELLSAKP